MGLGDHRNYFSFCDSETIAFLSEEGRRPYSIGGTRRFLLGHESQSFRALGPATIDFLRSKDLGISSLVFMHQTSVMRAA